ncbi:MAG: thymidine phosphorylase family protein [Patescibacteria group bacterium]|jgi:AMP phosphorylase
MPFFFHAKKLDYSTGGQEHVVVFQEDEGKILDIQPGDKVELKFNGVRLVASANFSRHKVQKGEIGLFKEVWQKKSLEDHQVIEVKELTRPESIKAIRKKLLGKPLTYQEIYSIIYDIVHNNIGTTEITYFVASGFMHSYSSEELFYLTKAMAETGERLKFPGKIVADKHSVGGLAGNRTTMIVIPIIASFGITIPKTSSRAITSPSGTADTMEVLAHVSFPTKKIKEIVRKTHACLVWGGSVNLAPADDKIIHISHPLSLEPYSKMVVSIMAKKVAMGVTHLVIDMPYGSTTKIPDIKTARKIKKIFSYVAKKFKIKLNVQMIPAREPVGRGVGPALEARDVMLVLQQKSWRPKDLERKAIRLAGILLELIGKVKKGTGQKLAADVLYTGKAEKKMRDIIELQGGNSKVDSEDLIKTARRMRICAKRSGKIFGVNNRSIDEIARILGAPYDKQAGVYLHKRYGERVRKGEKLFTIYSSSQDREALAKNALKNVIIYSIR